MLYRALALSLFVITLSSCADKKEENSSGAYTMPVESLAEGQKIAMDAQLDCGADCSPSVGLLAFATPENAGLCSAFLVAPDTIATNSHCIPDDLKEPGTSCKDRLWMHFAKEGDKETRIACDKIIYDSKNYSGAADKPDYAFVKLSARSTRPALRLSRAGFADGSSMRIHKVNPVRGAGRMKGKQEFVTCRTVQNSGVLESFFHDLAPVALITECLVVQGNSGSPVLASDGTVRGVVFAYRDLNDTREVFSNNKNLKLRESLVNLNFAANFACLHEQDGSEGRPAPACATHSTQLRQHLAKQASEENLQVRADLDQRMAALSDDFKWDVRYEKSGLKVSIPYAGVKAIPVPSCVNAATAARYTDGLSMNLPHWPVIESYDRYLRGRTELGTPEAVATNIKLFSPEPGEYTAVISGADFVYKVEDLKDCQ